MNYTNIFLQQFRYCPFCQKKLTTSARPENSFDKHQYSTRWKGNIFSISVKGDYFITPSKDNYTFIIQIVNGDIVPSTFANDFISLYDISINLAKKCDCEKGSFQQEAHLHYNRQLSAFVLEPKCETFSFSYENNKYHFTNNYVLKKSTLLKELNFIQPFPFIPFEKFNFESSANLFAKLNAIHLLI